MHKYLLAAALLFAFTFVAATRGAEEKKLASKDSKFIMNAATGGEMEVALGKVAATKGSSADVKDFGQMMVDDHTKANEKLKDLATKKGVDLTKAEDKAVKQESKEEASLSKKEGADFDKDYIKMMVKDHEEDVKEFEKASKDAEDADVKAFASETLPTLQKHLDKAKEIQGKIGK